MDRIDDAALGELARLAGEATPGPWRVTGCTRGADWVCSNRGCLTNTEDGTFRPANAAFIAAANPPTVAALVVEVRRLRAATDELVQLALRHHVECDDCWYSCPKSEGGTCNEEWHDGECRCGADAHNARVASIRAALDGGQ